MPTLCLAWDQNEPKSERTVAAVWIFEMLVPASMSTPNQPVSVTVGLEVPGLMTCLAKI